MHLPALLPTNSIPVVSVVVPCRNENGHVDAFIDSVLSQRLDGLELQVIIADGMSDDGTREILQSRASLDPRVVLVDNPGRIVSTGLNRAVAVSKAEFIVRMDVHTTYAEDYVVECLRALRNTDAMCVGGPWVAEGHGLLQRAVSQAFQSRFGSGGAASRQRDYDGPVDTVYLGAWRREQLLSLGGFDENLVRNQDDELNLRIVRSGGKVWQSSLIRSIYTPRASLTALFRQFHQYGFWKIPVLQKHHLPASIRHVAPFGFLAMLVTLALAAPFSAVAATAGLGLAAAYALAALVFARQASAGGSVVEVVAVAAAFACMHFGYASGFGRGIWDFVVRRRGAGASMTRLTR